MKARLVYACMMLLAAMCMSCRSQDESLGIVLSLEAQTASVSAVGALGLVVELRNQCAEPLRWRPLFEVPEMRCVVCVERVDGQVFLATGCQEPTFLFHNPVEITDVFPVGASGLVGGAIGVVEEAEETGWFARHTDEVGENGVVKRVPVYVGPLPEGQYEVYVKVQEGPPLEAQYPERSPGQGVYYSNRVPLAVVADGAAPRVRPRLGRVKGRLASVFSHRGVGLARAEALEAYGIKVRADQGTLAVERGKRRVVLPIAGVPGALPLLPRRGGPPLPAIAVKAEHLVPLRYVASLLGLQVVHDAKRKTYDLEPVSRRPSKIEARAAQR